MHFYELLPLRLKKILLIIVVATVPCSAWSQVDIWLSSGLEFGAEWCYDDQPVEIVGQPADGFFTGCGISSANGRWYFNPAQAGTGELTFPLLCTVVYTAPGGDTAMRTVKVHKPVVPMAGPDRAVCGDGSFTLAVKMLYVGDYSYQWSPSVGLVNPYAKETGGFVADSQQFLVYVRDTLTGCSGTDSVTLFNRAVRAEIETDRAVGCVGDSLILQATFTHEDWAYRWDLGDGTRTDSAIVAHVYRGAGFFPVMLVVSNSDCADTAYRNFEVSELHLELVGPDRVDAGEMLWLEARSDQSFQTVSWSPESIIYDQTAQTQQFVPDTTRTYIVVGVSDHGCVDSAEHTVIVNPRTMVPTAFSPNGDGRNDRFRVVTWGEPSVIRSFRVFDRWGKQVYGAVGATADAGWDGYIHGSPAEIGVYYYAIELESAGESLFYKGDVMLMR